MADFGLMAIDLISADKIIDDGEIRILRKHLYADNEISPAVAAGELLFEPLDLFEYKRRGLSPELRWLHRLRDD